MCYFGPMTILGSPLRLAAVALFLVVNASFYWHGLDSSVSFGIFMACSGLYMILLVFLFIRLIMHLLKGLEGRYERLTTGFIIASLFMVTWMPAGVFPPKMELEGAWLVAERDGIMNCETVLSLHSDSRAKQHAACFGFDHYEGTYTREGDTLRFQFGEGTGSYAVINLTPDQIDFGHLEYFRFQGDTLSVEMDIKHYQKISE